ncbi:ABC transporter permease [Micromonospora chersina]|uniref:ABC transporter permease n=1 Tax=Micromonospora chersina TaxID=47854 RepID=UPI0033D170D2
MPANRRPASIAPMFIALRDLRFARGRFVLIISVIALMTFMVVMLSGLAGGLGAASVSAVDALPVTHLAFQQPAPGQTVSFTNSTLPADTAARLAARPGITDAHSLGVSTTQLHKAATAAAVTVIGTDSALFPAVASGQPPQAGQVAVTTKLADDQHLRVGDQVVIAGTNATVAAVVADTSFNHLPVVYTDVATWQRLAHTDGVTAAALTGTPTADVAGVKVVGKKAAFDAVGGYSSEQGSLSLMRILLVVVSVLVIGSFFTVWTMQRSGDLAVVRAIGGSRGYLLRDALGQALLVMLAGTVVGAAVAAALGIVAARAVPFELTGASLALPLAAMTVVGLLGAAASIGRISKVDPLSALGAVR